MEDLESPTLGNPTPSLQNPIIKSWQSKRQEIRGAFIKGLLITIILLFRPNIQALFSGGKRGHKRGAQAT